MTVSLKYEANCVPQRRGTLLAGFDFRSEGNATSLGSSRGGAVERSETEGVALL